MAKCPSGLEQSLHMHAVTFYNDAVI